MSEQKPKKPIMILSLDTETGGFNDRINALMTVGLAKLELSKADDLSNIKKKEWRISNQYIVVEKTPNMIAEPQPRYVEQEALNCNKLNVYELETKGQKIKDVEDELCAYLDKLTNKYRVHLLGQNLKFDLGFILRNMPSFYKKLNKLTTHHELRTLSTAYNMMLQLEGEDSFVDRYCNSTAMDTMRKRLDIVSDGQTHSAAVDAEDNIIAFIRILERLKNCELTLTPC